VGRGGYGEVHGVKKADTGKLYALKTIRKRRAKQRSALQLCISERALLESLNTSLIASLKYSFQDAESLYLVFDLCTGGDLGYHLQRDRRFDLRRMRHYAAQIALALQCLHNHSIVYRDLKPENILLDQFGQARVSDMGLAQRLGPDGTLHGRCGTRGCA
jgi:serum/glucocorticoid-regulated kinase 2